MSFYVVLRSLVMWCTPSFSGYGQEVPKTVTNQSSVWWLGAVNSRRGCGLGCQTKRHSLSKLLMNLKSAKVNKRLIGKAIAEYLVTNDGIGNIERGALNCVIRAPISQLPLNPS